MDENLKTRLTELGFTEEQITGIIGLGAKTEEEMSLLREADFLTIPGVTVVLARKTVAAFAPKPTEAEVNTTIATSQNVLPELPDDPSFLNMLKVGGVLTVDIGSVISATRATIAYNIGLYDMPDKMLERMEAFAIQQGAPVGEVFYQLQKQLAERRYPEILAAIGATRTVVTEKRKKETLARINEFLWPALRGFQEQLRVWTETWSQGAANPATMIMAITMSQGGGKGFLPPGVLQPPDTVGLRDEAEAVIDRINRIFAGLGIPVSQALALDAIKIREVLENPSLPSSIGAANRDQMLKMLGIDVGADFVRLEQNVTRYALAIMHLPNVTAGNDEFAYLYAMYALGNSIPWDKLQGTATVYNPNVVRREPQLVRGDNSRSGQTNNSRSSS